MAEHNGNTDRAYFAQRAAEELELALAAGSDGGRGAPQLQRAYPNKRVGRRAQCRKFRRIATSCR